MDRIVNTPSDTKISSPKLDMVAGEMVTLTLTHNF